MHAVRMQLVHLGVLSVLLLLSQRELSRTEAHPQCLDSLPPFDKPRHWCRDYRPETCCSREDELQLIFNELLPAVREMSAEDRRRGCLSPLVGVLCTRCSPWAQHIYEDVPSEGFPSLCEPFCELFFMSCYSTLFSLFNLNSSSYERTEEDAARFCTDLKATFPHYCYPDIIHGPFGFRPNVNSSDLPSYEQDEGCLCGAEVASGLRNPIAAVPAGDHSGRLFIAEQKGKILVLTRDNDMLDEPFLDISDRVLTSRRTADERGLLGLAFSPNYRANGNFYVYYSSRGRTVFHQSTISEFHVNASNPNRADPTSERVIMTIPQPQSNHNGGQLFFGVDGYLYIALGDGGGAGDRHGTVGNGLDPTTLLGSILRIDVSNPNVTYSIPKDNPFATNSTARPEIYAYGLRNPWRCSVDRGDKNGVRKGRIFCGDVGQARFEEIDIIEKGENYGWRAYEGFSCYDRRLCTPELRQQMRFPIHNYSHADGLSVTGGYVYRGCLFPDLQGDYIYGDFSKGILYALKESEGKWTNRRLCLGSKDTCHSGLIGREKSLLILSFAEDDDGELYILTTDLASVDVPKGSLIQIIDPSRRTNPGTCTLTRSLPTN